MFVKNLSAKERILLVVCIVLAAMALTYNLVIEPLIVSWAALDEKIDAKSSLLKKNVRLLGMAKMLESEHLKYEGFIETGENEERELRKTLAEIENLSKKSNCRIVNVKPFASKTIGNYKEISFEVTAEGSIDELSRFLYEIEASGAYLRVKRFTLMSKHASEGLRGTFLIARIIAV